MMSACTFLGHRECYGLSDKVLYGAVEALIGQGVKTFYVGHQGGFDSMAYGCLKRLQKKYTQIRICVVLAYIPANKETYFDMSDTMYPEIEGHPKFAIERRNRWMLENSQCCICYITHTWGGAYKFVCMAKRRGLTVINLGSIQF